MRNIINRTAQRLAVVLERVVSWLCRRVINHSWRDTRVNGYYIAVEQRCCICGAYRPHYFEDYIPFEEPNWHEGRHNRSVEWHEPANNIISQEEFPCYRIIGE